MHAISQTRSALCSLLSQQAGVATRVQLSDLGFNQHAIRAQISAMRWQSWGFHVVILHNFEPTRKQLMWAAVLDAGYPAALASHTSLELHGFKPFAREAEQLHLLIERGAKVSAHPMIAVHESRRLKPEYHVSVAGLPCTSAPRSAIDAAAWQPWPRFACALVAAVVQQGLCTAEDLELEMRYVGRIRHKAHLREAIDDIRGGSQALSEIDLVRLCRRFGLQEPDRQVKRADRYGRLRYLDAEWKLKDGRRVVLEVDGSHHLEVESWQADMRRERAVVIGGAHVLRATAVEVRVEPKHLVSDLLAIGVPRVVRTQLTYNSTGF
jgi:hypothetical protein